MTTEYIRLSLCVDPLWREGMVASIRLNYTTSSVSFVSGLHPDQVSCVRTLANPPMKRYRLKER